MASSTVPPTPQEWTVLSMLEWATAYFESKKVDQPRLSIEWLLADVLSMPRLQLYVHFDRPLTTTEREVLRDMVKARATHKPLQYITGSTSFMGLELQVSEGVLIPRPETEELVDHALSRISSRQKQLTILDVGCGSGCIALAMKASLPEAVVHGVDVSKEALEVSNQNSSRLDLPVEWHHGSFIEPPHDSIWSNTESVDWLLSNPPYIHPDEATTIHPQVKNFEPAQALFADDPVELYQTLWMFASSVLKPGGQLGFECNPLTIEKVLDIGLRLDFEAEMIPDFQGLKRFIFAQKTS